VAVNRRALDEGMQLRQEITLDRSGGPLTYDITVTPIEFVAGRFTHLVTAAIDVTARKQAEEALRASEARCRTLFENDSSIKLLYEPDTGAIVDANPAAAAFYGWTRAQLRMMNVAELNALPAAEVFAEAAKGQLAGRNHNLTRHRLASGAVREVEMYKTLIELNGRMLRYAIVHDVTERTQAEDALRRSEEALKRSQAVAHVGHWTWDTRSNTVTWSDEMKLIFGVDPALVGADLETLICRMMLRCAPPWWSCWRCGTTGWRKRPTAKRRSLPLGGRESKRKS
jgi:PAS domain S-box-containing protein